MVVECIVHPLGDEQQRIPVMAHEIVTERGRVFHDFSNVSVLSADTADKIRDRAASS